MYAFYLLKSKKKKRLLGQVVSEHFKTCKWFADLKRLGTVALNNSKNGF